MHPAAHPARDAGFTLIEVIVVLVLTGVLAAVAGMGMTSGVRGFIAAREATELAQEAQLAQDRISRELIEIVLVPASSSTSITLQNINNFRRIAYSTSSRAITIAESTGSAPAAGTAGDVLIDGVTAFSLTYWNSNTAWDKADSRDLTAIDISMTLTAPAGTTRTFTNRVVPRNNENNGGAEATMTPPNLSEFSACFVATAAFGDATHPAVVALREFRDKRLMTWEGGRSLVRTYYRFGPTMADAIRNSTTARHICAALLTVVAAVASMAVHAPYALPAMVLLPFWVIRKRQVFLAAAARLSHAAGACWRLLQQPRLTRHPQRGAVLLSAIIAIAAFSVMLASMVPMMTAATQGEYVAIRGGQAYYLAESGFNSAGSMFLAQPDDQSRKNLLENMDRATYTLQGGAGSFSYEVEPYWFEVNTLTGTSIAAHAYGTPPAVTRFSNLKWIRVGTGDKFFPCKSVSINNKTVTFTGTGFTGTERSDVFLAAATSSISGDPQPVSDNGSLRLATGQGSAFPEVNGMFTLRQNGFNGRTPYVYRTRNGDTLEGVRLADKDATWSALSVPDNTKVTLEAFIRLASTGIAPDGTTRRVVYNVPIGWILGGGTFSKEQYQDSFDSTGNLNTYWQNSGYTSDDGHIGSQSIADIDGTKALKITGMQALNESTGWGGFIDGLLGFADRILGRDLWSIIFFNWGNTTTNVAQSWMDAGGYLSYDLQFKMKAADQNISSANGLRFFGGLSFRGHSVVDSNKKKHFVNLGVSLVRARLYRVDIKSGSKIVYGDWTNYGDLPQDLVPGLTGNPQTAAGPLFSTNDEIITSDTGSYQVRYSKIAIVLWERDETSTRWLAYKILDPSSGLITRTVDTTTTPNMYRDRLKDWSTLLVRMTEGKRLTFSGGGGTAGSTVLQLNYNDFIKNNTATIKARIIGPPFATNWGWSTAGAAGWLALTNIEGTPSGAQYVNGVQHATTSSLVDSSKHMFTRVYYASATNTAPGTPATGDTNPLNDVRGSTWRLTGSERLNWIADDYEQWQQQGNDKFTLVQWDDVNTGYATGYGSENILGTGLSKPSVVEVNERYITSPYDPANPPTSFEEGIAITASGPGSTSLYFDDFGLQLDIRGGKGFLPPIQQ